MEKLYTSKTFLKMTGTWEDVRTPHPISLYPPLGISYRNHPKSLAYFSLLAPLILFFLLKDRVKRGAWRSAPLKYAPGRCPIFRPKSSEDQKTGHVRSS